MCFTERSLGASKNQIPSTPATWASIVTNCWSRGNRNGLMRKILLLPIRFYQYAISPLMASHCRHYPTCSQYAVEAITHHGALKGLFLAIKRLLRCHPWAEGGYDPVPGISQAEHAESINTCVHTDHPQIINQTKQ